MSRECQKVFKANGILERIRVLCESRKLRNSAILNVEEKRVTKSCKLIFSERQIRVVEKVIVANTEISRCHLTPELKLHLLTPNCRLYNEPITQETFAHPSSGKNYEERIFHEPFWSIYWPGGQALTRFILDQGINLLNKSHGGTSFLDIGSGCGASAIAAKMIGASRAVANDIDQVACVAANLNASLNGVEIETTSKNLLENPARNYGCSFDVILLGDLLYDDEMAESLIPWLEETVRENRSRVYLGDPGRHALTDTLKRRMEFKQEYSLPGNVRRENYGYDSAAVWQFKID
ncbi:electron transfer flavoprotein beta subunit lysine methyltransferase-like isoform X1 [Venturia canescens]|uniref:electron transfer flavoprotein beta subunit lysine methyltransferase-like isoform X1 n=1 Tax=Venturia canescens TaxID=32260 RepID=UPI001C9C4C5E|nr:electron transfer flavoprotein beta subunit lysine methyltransferase-like isoform X1 [Venturia canescens]XP_043269417.1 electron transfer flavoprotein beta subunit lysine methyltransferase-like isoform X1 [Venturia canescens]XP_043269418.1 electron transfer flavoprotein beta subunit lysine methyltransferase-like isoform X1 [Venturia canescens]XP_043269419.1 electron transfer flavoprotein beta subunit lysine methyltransferase-like isoform X1 [Venturia canescens]XP_043269421.1 electron transfe